MSQNRYFDVEIELKELCKDLGKDIVQTLNYYQASVYKDEMAETIAEKIQKLKMVVELFADESLVEPFADYEAELQNGCLTFNLGESAFPSRVLRLVTNLEQLLKKKSGRVTRSTNLQSRVKKKKKELLSICQYGSRNWMFFQKI